MPPLGHTRDAKPKEQQGNHGSCKTGFNECVQEVLSSSKCFLKKLGEIIIHICLSGTEAWAILPAMKTDWKPIVFSKY